MDGDPVPDDHGGPMRLVVPGWYGIWWVKWVQGMTFTREPFRGFWQNERYTYQDEDGRVRSVVEEQRPRAMITFPLDGDLVVDGTLVQGLVWGGEGGIVSVEVTVDDGETWFAAQLAEAAGRWGWRRWQAVLPAGLPRGLRRMAARATDGSGDTQDWDHPDDRLGYANDGIHQIGIDLLAAVPAGR